MSALRKLMAVRMALQAIQIKPTGRNTFAKYDYLQLDDFLPMAQKFCSEHGLCGVCSFTADTATLTITDLDNETSKVVLTSPMGSAELKGCHEVQNIGAVQTYQRRYLWVSALELVEHDALDSGPGKATDNASKPTASASPSKTAETSKAFPPYPEDSFNKNLKEWTAQICAGKHTAAKIISMVLTKYTMTQEQKDALYRIEPPANPAAQNPVMGKTDDF